LVIPPVFNKRVNNRGLEDDKRRLRELCLEVEVVTLFPLDGAFIRLAGRMVDPALGVAVGYQYSTSVLITVASKMTKDVCANFSVLLAISS
jgi:hypothetical protein